ncbi:glycoside hydrolase family 108 protein [Pseudomonas juntendi]|jgi:lysozyme family protein|uniref:glycoside hydrolase family 108 protein n=1 Tax=Pseudomonas TaxID=286 RepID=UPI001F19BFDC|nr:glycosyl hydrolase 108 family protein [Pseudomonas juntendi]MCO7058253.1 hypothetical protein [Pseudomonas juntendi]UJM15225.1 hypothetical protein L1P09_25770 [Pseudomonas juntendi]
MTLQAAVAFPVAFERVVGHEGKYQDNRKDRGNWTTGVVGQGELKGTKYGISAMAYPDLDIKNLTLEQAKAIYRRDFWDRAQMGQLPAAVVFQLFDMGINHGFGNTIRMLQRAAGVLDDGRVGPISLAALAKMELNDLIMRLAAQRLRFIAQISTFDEFGRGWVNRVAGNLEYAAEDN